MKKIIYSFLCSLLSLPLLFSQALGEWKTHLAYYETTGVAEAANNVFGVANGGLYSYNKEDNSTVYYSLQNGLNDTDVSLIRYNPTAKGLLIVYSNGNIDIMGEGGITNLPFLKNSSSIQDKTVYSIYFWNERAYLSAAFGIIVINMEKKEIIETYRLNKPILSTCIKDKNIYAASPGGTLWASTSDNLLDSNNWKPFTYGNTSLSGRKVHGIDLYQNTLCFNDSTEGIFYLNASGEMVRMLKPVNGMVVKMAAEGNHLLACSASQFFIFNSLSSYSTVNESGVKDISSRSGTNFWVAASDKGLRGYKSNGNNNFTLFFSDMPTYGPKRNYSDFMVFQDQKLYVAGGGRLSNRYNRPGTLMRYEGSTWYNYDENEVTKNTGYNIRDYMSVAIDPQDSSHLFIASFGEGLLEFKDNAFLKLYTHENSLLEASASPARNYIRLSGLAFDKQNNLWIANNNNGGRGLKILKAEGSWASLPYLSNNDMLDKVMITSSGQVWINIFRQSTTGSPGIFVLNPNKTADDASDDQYRLHTSFPTTSDGNITASEFYCMVEDKDGTVWIGSNKGPIICSSPSRASDPNANLIFSRIIKEGDDGLLYAFLDGESVRTLAVDGGNRKWIGTGSSGVFLVSPDGMEIIENFTAENSPLLSNTINSIAINDLTGEVFIGTDKGMVSYMAEGTEGSESYSDIYAYPNPVRPEFEGRVTITGLMMDSNVKITDVSGNLIYQAKSVGGQLSWDCRNAKGKRVATGVYLVLAATPEAKESVVTKILVVK